MLVQVASQYDSKIYLEADSKRVNAKSIMGMMTLGLVTGESITVEADGTERSRLLLRSRSTCKISKECGRDNTFIVRYKQAKEAAVDGRSLFKF